MSDNFHLDPGLTASLAKLATIAPGFAGAVVSLAFVERLTARGRVLTVLVGLATAAFVAPALSEGADLIWPGAMPAAVSGCIMFLTGLCAMGCIPPLLGWAKRKAGDPLSLMKTGGPQGSGDAA